MAKGTEAPREPQDLETGALTTIMRVLRKLPGPSARVRVVNYAASRVADEVKIEAAIGRSDPE